MNIIAVDNDKTALDALCDGIGQAAPDGKLFGFRSAIQALEFVITNPCDVAFLAIKMGEIDGIELAKRIKKWNPAINIIFVSDCLEYALEAFHLRASGYLKKPVSVQSIREELQNLRYPACQSAEGVYAQTFGNFELFVNGEAVTFSRAKAKELIAYLIDRHGAGASRKEIAGVLFENRGYDRVTQDYVNHVITDMIASLKQAGADQILVRKRNFLAVDVSKFACDLYAYEKGDVPSMNKFKGEYMVQYSWAEVTAGMLYKQII